MSNAESLCTHLRTVSEYFNRGLVILRNTEAANPKPSYVDRSIWHAHVVPEPIFKRLPPSAIQRIADICDTEDRNSLRFTCRLALDTIDSGSSFSMREHPPHQLVPLFDKHAKQDFQHLRHVNVWLWPTQAKTGRDIAREILAARLPNLQSLHVNFDPTSTNLEGAWNTTPFVTWGTNDFVSIPGQSESTAQPAPELLSLTLDCGHLSVIGQPAHLCDAKTWEIPMSLFAEGCKLRRLAIRGLAWSMLDYTRFPNLVSFMLFSALNVSGIMLEELIACLPALRIFRLDCIAFQVDSPNDSSSGRLSHSGFSQLNCVVLKTLLGTEEYSLLGYFVRRGAPDVVIIPMSYVDAPPLGDILPPRVYAINVGPSGISLRYLPSERHPTGRVRIGTTLPLLRLRDLMPKIDLSHLTALSIHERAANHILHDFGADGYDDPSLLFFGQEVPSTQTFFPCLEVLTIWLASCFDHRTLGMYSDQPLIGIFTVRPTPINPTRFPRLSTFVLSAGAPPSQAAPIYPLPPFVAEATCCKYMYGLIHFECACDNGFTVSLREIHLLLAGCAFPALDTVRLCGLVFVNWDLDLALVELQRLSGVKCLDVQFAPAMVGCDVGAAYLDDFGHADELFACLEAHF